MPTNQDLTTFSRLAEALAPWLEHIVVVGGWAHRLYQYHPLAQPLDYPLLTTLDADIAVPNPLPNDLETNMRERLVNAGFEEEFLGEENPPATHFRLGTDPTGFYAEFLTPLIGSDYKHGKRDATTVIAGVAVQKLRYVDLLLVSPWPIKLDPQKGLPVAEAISVRVANPAAYLAQKLLVVEKRPKDEQGKEILYIYDTINLFASVLPEIRAEWRETSKPNTHAKAVRVVERAALSMFAEITDRLREGALIVRERGLSPESIRIVCKEGLQQIFG